MSEFKQVRMGVAEGQIEDMRFIQREYNLPNEASAVATALAVTRALAERVNKRSRLIVHYADGTRQEFRMPR